MHNQPNLPMFTDEDRLVTNQIRRLGEAFLTTNPRTCLQLLSYTNIGYYLVQNGRFVLASPGLCRMLGYSMDELLDIRPLEIVIPADRERVRKLTDKIAWGENEPCRCNCGLVTKGGKYITVQLENVPTKLASQRAYHGTVINGHDLFKQDNGLYEVEAFRTIIDNVNDGLVVCDLTTGQFIDVNTKITEIFGYSKAELMQFSLLDLTKDDSQFDKRRLMELIEQVTCEGPQIIEWPVRHPNGSLMWINANLRHAVIQDQDVLLITLRDVTDLHITTHQLISSEERFRLAASLTSDLIYEENTASGTLFWYGDIDHLIGCSLNTFPRTTRAWKEVIAPEMLSAVQGQIDSATQMDKPFQLEYQVVRKDGTRVWLSERGKNVVDKTGKIVRCIGTITNINSLIQAKQALQESEGRFRLLAENVRDIIFSVQIRPELKFEYLSPALTDISGYLPETFYNDPFTILDIVDQEHRGLLDQILQEQFNLNRTWRASWRGANGQLIWTEQNITVIKDMGRIVLQGVARDVTKNQMLEDRMNYLTTHDNLTGLPNRHSFEEYLNSALNNNSDWSLMVCDLDGLKLINDTLGHQVGDAILVATANIISNSAPSQGMVARIGGDEFALLLPGNQNQVLQDTINSIKDQIILYNKLHPNTYLSLSVGYAINGENGVKNTDLFKEADNNMYRQKLLNSLSIRNSIIKGLSNTLKARDFHTEDHGERMQTLILAMAGAANLDENQVNGLLLLAQFHDIGKVGIPDHILFKPGPLDVAEYETMKRHSEIGFRIAQTVPDLVMVSDWILKHHEWWNGQGYPLRLQGEAIPLECRILSIVDAYDAMTNQRPYRQAMTKKEALDEILAGAGTQFDPRLANLFVRLLA